MDYSSFLNTQVPDLMAQITPETEVLWGKMSPQHIIEHLGLLFMVSNGKIKIPANAEPERLAYRKMRFFEADVPFPRSFRTTFIPEEAPPLRFADIQEAKLKVAKEQQRFNDHYTENPGAKEMHPVLGQLDFAEWTQFHARHIKHHLAQLGFEL